MYKKDPKNHLGVQIDLASRQRTPFARRICPLRTPERTRGRQSRCKLLFPAATSTAGCFPRRAMPWYRRICQVSHPKGAPVLAISRGVSSYRLNRVACPLDCQARRPKGCGRVSKASRHKAGGRQRHWRTILFRTPEIESRTSAKRGIHRGRAFYGT